MTDESKPGLHIDDDWKSEAQAEKERLAAQEQQRAAGAPGPEEPVGFFDIVNLVAIQAAIGLGGLQGPGGERIPPNLPAARHHIDMLEVLKQKTKGNLTPEEAQVLDAVIYDLQMNYVTLATGVPPPGARPGPGGAPAPGPIKP